MAPLGLTMTDQEISQNGECGLLEHQSESIPSPIDTGSKISISDSVIQTSIHINQESKENGLCPNCKSVTQNIIACRMCTELYCCNICNNEIEKEKEELINKFPVFYDPDKTPVEYLFHHPELTKIAFEHLTRTCPECYKNYLKSNDLEGLSKIHKLKKKMYELIDKCFDGKNYVWPKMENYEWAPLQYEMHETEQYFWYKLQRIPDVYPRLEGYPENFAKYFIDLLVNMNSKIYSKFEQYKSIKRKEPIEHQNDRVYIKNDPHLVMINYGKYENLDSPQLFMDSKLTPIYNSEMKEVIPYSNAKQMLGESKWVLDFELNLGELHTENVEIIVMCFYRKNLE